MSVRLVGSKKGGLSL